VVEDPEIEDGVERRVRRIDRRRIANGQAHSILRVSLEPLSRPLDHVCVEGDS
jgi:hypothetical protein